MAYRDPEGTSPRRLCCRRGLASLVFPVARCQEVVYHEISNVTAQSLTGRKVEKEVHPGKDATQRRFFRRGRKARERAFHSRHDLGGNAELEMALAEERTQHLRPGRTDHRVSARIRGVRGGVADLGK